ncbi:MAG: shikimate dehydrogenase [Pseudomonadota bacterium]
MNDGVPRAAVFGWPVEHSRSPLVHGYWLKELGITGQYERYALPPEEVEDLPEILRRRGFVGGNVTIPHKEAAFRLSDEADPVAVRLGAANTLWFESGRLIAANTDGFGFLSNLDARARGWDRNRGGALVLGAGGAARAIVLALCDRGFDPVLIANRTAERAEALVSQFGAACRAVPLQGADNAVADVGLIVNTTSGGMNGNDDPPLSLDRAVEDAVVTDIVYTPLRTGLLRRAEARGLRTVDGLGMLLHQAVPGFEKWFGGHPSVTEALRAAVIDDLEASRCS